MKINNNFAKLIDNSPSFAPNPIRIEDNYIGNPPDEVYTNEGYKSVQYIEYPQDPIGENYYWEEVWKEIDNIIMRDWELHSENQEEEPVG